MSASFLKIGFNVESAMNSMRSLSTSYTKNMSAISASSKAVSTQLVAANRAISMSFHGVNSAIQSAGNKLRWYGLMSSLVLGQIMRENSQFEFSMRRVKAILNLNEEQFKDLRTEALRLGRVTEHTAKAVAESMGNLAIAGLRMTEVMSVMPSMLAIATAGNVSLAFAAEASAGVLRAFTKDAEQMNSVAGVLSSTFTTTNTTLESISNSLRYVAPIANKTGVELEEVAAGIGVLGDAGVRGSMAGTSLRMTLLRLAKGMGTELGPKVFSMAKAIASLSAGMVKGQGIALDSNKIFESSGEGYKRLDFVVQHLNEVFGNMAKEQQNAYLTAIVGARAATGMMAMLSRGANDLRLNINNALFGGIKNTLQMSGTVFEQYGRNIERLRNSLKLTGQSAGEISKSIQELYIDKEIPWNVNLKFVDQEGKKVSTTGKMISDDIKRKMGQGEDATELQAAQGIIRFTESDINNYYQRLRETIKSFTDGTEEAKKRNLEFVKTTMEGLSQTSKVYQRFRAEGEDAFIAMDGQTAKAAATFQTMVGILKEESNKAKTYLDSLSETDRIKAVTQQTDVIYQSHLARMQAISEKFLGNNAKTILEALELEKEINKPIAAVTDEISRQLDQWKSMPRAAKEAMRKDHVDRMRGALETVNRVQGKTVSQTQLQAEAAERVADVISGYSTTLDGFAKTMLGSNSAIDIQAQQLASLKGQFLLLRSAVSNTAIVVGAAIAPLFISVSEYLVTLQNNIEELREQGSNVVTSLSFAIERAFTGFDRGVSHVNGLIESFKALENNIQRAVYIVTVFGALLLPLGGAMLALSKTSGLVVAGFGSILKLLPALTIGVAPLLAITGSLLALKVAWDENLGGIRETIKIFKDNTTGTFKNVIMQAQGVLRIWNQISQQKSLAQVLADGRLVTLFGKDEKAIERVYEILLKVRGTIRDIVLEFRNLGSSGNEAVSNIVREVKSFFEIMKQTLGIVLKLVKSFWEFASVHPTLVKMVALFLVFRGPIMGLYGAMIGLSRAISAGFNKIDVVLNSSIKKMGMFQAASQRAMVAVHGSTVLARTGMERMFVQTGSALAAYMNFLPGTIAVNFLRGMYGGMKALPVAIVAGLKGIPGLFSKQAASGIITGMKTAVAKSPIGDAFKFAFKGRGVESAQVYLNEMIPTLKNGLGENMGKIMDLRGARSAALQSVSGYKNELKSITKEIGDWQVKNMKIGPAETPRFMQSLSEQIAAGDIAGVRANEQLRNRLIKINYEYEKAKNLRVMASKETFEHFSKLKGLKFELENQLKIQKALTKEIPRQARATSRLGKIFQAIKSPFRPFLDDIVRVRNAFSLTKFGMNFDEIKGITKTIRSDVGQGFGIRAAFQKDYPLLVRFARGAGGVQKAFGGFSIWFEKFKLTVGSVRASLFGFGKAAENSMKGFIMAMKPMQRFMFLIGGLINVFMIFPSIIKGIAEGFSGVSSKIDETKNGLTFLKDLFVGFFEGFNEGWKTGLSIIQSVASVIGGIISWLVKAFNVLTQSIFGTKQELESLGTIFSKDTTKVIGYSVGILMAASALRQALVAAKALSAFVGVQGILGLLFKGKGAAVATAAASTAGAKLGIVQRAFMGLHKYLIAGTPAIGRAGKGLLIIGKSGQAATTAFSGFKMVLGGVATVLGKVFIIITAVVAAFDFFKNLMKGMGAGIGIGKAALLGLGGAINGLAQGMIGLVRIILKMWGWLTKWIPGSRTLFRNLDEGLKGWSQGIKGALVENPLEKWTKEAEETRRKAYEKASEGNRKMIQESSEAVRTLTDAFDIQQKFDNARAGAEANVAGMKGVQERLAPALESYKEIQAIVGSTQKMLSDQETPLKPEQLHRLVSPFKTLQAELGNLSVEVKNAGSDADKLYASLEKMKNINLGELKDAVSSINESRALSQIEEARKAGTSVAGQVKPVVADIQGIGANQLDVSKGAVNQIGKLSSSVDEMTSNMLNTGSRSESQMNDELRRMTESVMQSAGGTKNAVNNLNGALNTGARNMSGMTAGVGSVQELGNKLQTTLIPTNAKGGIFSRPTLGIVGEAGPEIVAPLAKFLEMAKATTTDSLVGLGREAMGNMERSFTPARNAVNQTSLIGSSALGNFANMGGNIPFAEMGTKIGSNISREFSGIKDQMSFAGTSETIGSNILRGFEGVKDRMPFEKISESIGSNISMGFEGVKDRMPFEKMSSLIGSSALGNLANTGDKIPFAEMSSVISDVSNKASVLGTETGRVGENFGSVSKNLYETSKQAGDALHNSFSRINTANNMIYDNTSGLAGSAANFTGAMRSTTEGVTNTYKQAGESVSSAFDYAGSNAYFAGENIFALGGEINQAGGVIAGTTENISGVTKEFSETVGGSFQKVGAASSGIIENIDNLSKEIVEANQKISESVKSARTSSVEPANEILRNSSLQLKQSTAGLEGPGEAVKQITSATKAVGESTAANIERTNGILREVAGGVRRGTEGADLSEIGRNLESGASAIQGSGGSEIGDVLSSAVNDVNRTRLASASSPTVVAADGNKVEINASIAIANSPLDNFAEWKKDILDQVSGRISEELDKEMDAIMGKS